MTENKNPYSAPRSYQYDGGSIWGRIWKGLLKSSFWFESGIREKFLSGTPVFQYGVLFFVDPADKHLIHAAVPLLEMTDARKKLNVDEAKRELRNLIVKHREIEEDIRDRMLSVRFIVNYRNVEDQVCEPIVAPWSESNTDNTVG